MNAISQILTADQILLDLDASSKKRVFEHAGMLFEQKLGMPRASIFDSLFAREKLGSTGLGQGIAIPHGRIKGLKAPLLAVLRSETAVPFEAPDGLPVQLLVVLLVPEHATEEHLEILSELAELLSNANLRQTLVEATDPAAIHKLLSDWEPYRPAVA